MKFKYYRHATFLMKIGDTKILVDPMYIKKSQLLPIPSTLNFRRNPIRSFPEEHPKMAEGDILLITHHHFDHFDKIAAKELSKQLRIISPFNGLKRLQRMGFKKILPMHPGQDYSFENLTIHALPVKHSQRLEKMLYKPGLGYLIQSSEGSVYISGDTILFKDLLEDLNRFQTDLAIFYGGGARIPILGRHTLASDEIISMIRIINPKISIIIHLDSLNHCTENRNAVKKWIDAANLPVDVILPVPGEEFDFELL